MIPATQPRWPPFLHLSHFPFCWPPLSSEFSGPREQGLCPTPHHSTDEVQHSARICEISLCLVLPVFLIRPTATMCAHPSPSWAWVDGTALSTPRPCPPLRAKALCRKCGFPYVPVLRNVQYCPFLTQWILLFGWSSKVFIKVALPTFPVLHPTLPWIILPALTKLHFSQTPLLSCLLVWLLLFLLPGQLAPLHLLKFYPSLKGRSLISSEFKALAVCITH